MKEKYLISGENVNIVKVEEVSKKNDAVVVNAKLPKSAEERKRILQAAGVDTSNMFAMGDSMLVRVVNGVPEEITDTDSVYDTILKGGMVPDRRLFRRWIMSQMFHILRDMNKRNSMSEIIKKRGYEYSWRVMIEELRMALKMYNNGDVENGRERMIFLRKDLFYAMAAHYVDCLKNYIDRLNVRHCKGVPYKVLRGRNIFCSDIDNKVISPLVNAMIKIDSSRSMTDLLENVSKFNSLRIKLGYDYTPCETFVSAYKGIGGYYTMKNLILFHGCLFSQFRGRKNAKDLSLNYLKSLANEYKNEGWRMIGVLKSLIDENDIDVAGKIDEWRRKKLAAKYNK